MVSNSPTICLFIPTYNSEKSIGRVLGRIPESSIKDIKKIILIDNSSSDRTLIEIESFACEHPGFPIRLLKNTRNQLLGGSTIVALKYAQEMSIDYLICLHGDGQADAAELPKFISYCQEDKYDFILGSRLMPQSRAKDYSRPRLMANFFLARLQQFILKQNIYDIGAFIAVNVQTLADFPFDCIKSDMSFFPNLILTLCKFRSDPLRFKEFPISWGKVESSSVNVYAYFIKHLYRIVKISLGHLDLDKNNHIDIESEVIIE